MQVFSNVAVGCCSLTRGCKFYECRTLTEVKWDGLLTWDFRLLLEFFGLIWLFQLSTLKYRDIFQKRVLPYLALCSFLMAFIAFSIFVAGILFTLSSKSLSLFSITFNISTVGRFVSLSPVQCK